MASSSTASATVIPADIAGAVAPSPEEMTLTVLWSGNEYAIRVSGDDNVGELKQRICDATNVRPNRQKLLYPKLSAKLRDESVLLSVLDLKPPVKMTMIGTVEDDIIVEPVDYPEIIDDFELGLDEVDIEDEFSIRQNLSRLIAQYKLKISSNENDSLSRLRSSIGESTCHQPESVQRENGVRTLKAQLEYLISTYLEDMAQQRREIYRLRSELYRLHQLYRPHVPPDVHIPEPQYVPPYRTGIDYIDLPFVPPVVDPLAEPVIPVMPPVDPQPEFGGEAGAGIFVDEDEDPVEMFDEEMEEDDEEGLELNGNINHEIAEGEGPLEEFEADYEIDVEDDGEDTEEPMMDGDSSDESMVYDPPAPYDSDH